MSIYLIAAHLFGDFILQSRWEAVAKFTDWRVRLRHVLIYSLPFFPIAILFHRQAWGAGVFIVLLIVTHFATDSRRFYSTPGDWIAWHLNRELRDIDLEPEDGGPTLIRDVELTKKELPPNPWPPLPIVLDQSIHICTIALLAGLFLR